MSRFAARIRPHVEQALREADAADRGRDPARAFSLLERAHVLGQAATSHHVRVHWRMFVWGWRHRDLRECAGQLVRIVGAATKTAFGWVPTGNTGGARLSPFQPLPVAPELAALIDEARRPEK